MSKEDNSDPAPATVEVAYQITITKIERNVPFRNKEYEKIGVKKDPDTGEEKDEYGYVYFDDTKIVEGVLYKQELAQIQLPEIIKAANGMDG